jgi:hypothetical protein
VKRRENVYAFKHCKQILAADFLTFSSVFGQAKV